MKKLLVFIGVIVCIYGIVLAVLYAAQDNMIYLPTELPKDHKYRLRYPAKELFLTHENGAQINALAFKTNKTAKGVVLYFHGNSRNLQHWGRFVNKFLKRGYDVFMIDYQGYGKSDGEVGQQAFYDDAMLAYDHVKKEYGDNIILYGRSLGTGPASYLATKVDAKMLFLITPFYSIPDVVKVQAPYVFIPFSLKTEFPNYKHIGEARMPIHIAHGDNDNIVPLASGIKLKPLLREGDSFTIIEGGSHRNLVIYDKFEALLDRLL